MDSQIAGCGEPLAAGLAGVGPGACVDRLVFSEVLLPGETLSTDVAHEGLDFGMGHLVVAERAGGGKGAFAGVALERRLLQPVRCLVDSELPQQPELPVALVAAQHLVGVVLLGLPQLVAQLVSLQGLGLVETFITRAAGERFQVAGHVFLQLVLLMETFVTEFTKKPLFFVQFPTPSPLRLLLLLPTQTCTQKPDPHHDSETRTTIYIFYPLPPGQVQILSYLVDSQISYQLFLSSSVRK